MWDCWLYRRLRMGSGDGAGYSELREDVIYFHGSPLRLYATMTLEDELGVNSVVDQFYLLLGEYRCFLCPRRMYNHYTEYMVTYHVSCLQEAPIMLVNLCTKSHPITCINFPRRGYHADDAIARENHLPPQLKKCQLHFSLQNSDSI